ncbi:MAG: alpha/beta fold hydrolase [Lautropia sp.]
MSCAETVLSIGGVETLVREAGAGTPLLYLHGGGGVPTWLPFFEELARHHRVTVPDHPGFGRSAEPEWIRDVAGLAMFYLDYLDRHANAGGAHLVGHSLGGWIAAELAARNDHALRSLTLIAPAGLPVPAHPFGDVFGWGPQETVRRLFHADEHVRAALARQPTAEQQRVAARDRRAFDRYAGHPRLTAPDLAHWLHRIRVPVQLIWGANDEVIPAACAVRWTSPMPTARLSVLPACGHLPMVEKSDETSAVVLAFVADAAYRRPHRPPERPEQRCDTPH